MILETFKPVVDRLVSDGLLERINWSTGAWLILSRTFASATGESAVYIRRKGLHREEGKLLLLRHLNHKGQEEAPLEDLAQVLPFESKNKFSTYCVLWSTMAKPSLRAEALVDFGRQLLP